MLPLFYRPHDTSQETRQWLLRIAPLPFFLSPPQATQRCRQTSDSEGIRTPAGRAQWISGPSPWPFGHTVMLVPASHSAFASAGNRTRVTSMATMYSATRPLTLLQLLANAWHVCGHPIPHPRGFASVLKISSDSEGIQTSADCSTALLSFSPSSNTALPPNVRQRGDSNPCGQSSMDFWSISLAIWTHCHACSCLPQHLHQPGIEPGSNRRQRCILPLDHWLLQLLANAWHVCRHPIPHPCGFAWQVIIGVELLRLQENNIECTKNLIHFPICACHPCTGAMLIFSASFQFYRMFPEGNPRSPPPVCFLPHSSHPTNAGCFQVGANSFFKSTRSRIAARHMRPPGVEPGAQAWEACMLPLFYRPHDTSQETRQWLLRIASLPFFLSPPQATQRCRQTSDSEGIRTPAGRAQWISGPSPWPFGHAVMLVPASDSAFASAGNRTRVTSMATTRPLMLLQLLANAWHVCRHPIPHPCGFASVLKISSDSEGIQTSAGRAQCISGPSP